MTITVYGIKNCNTMKKAFDWLDAHNITYTFHDYKKQAPERDVLELAIAQHGWETVINRKGMTWRKLSDERKASIDESNAIDLALEMPSIIKRPLITGTKSVILGFDETAYDTAFTK